MKILNVIAISSAVALGSAAIALAQDQTGPMPDPNAAANPAMKSPDNMTDASLAKGHNSFTKSEARARIEKAGYSDVTDLTLDSNGLWQARARQAGHLVHVALDYKGNVSGQ
jgi:hypothetical protein